MAHIRRVKTGPGLAAVVAHNCRATIYDEQGKPKKDLPPWISNPDLAKLNETERLTNGQLHLRRSATIKTAGLLRKPQRNAAAGVEVVISASPEFFAEKTPNECKAYFTAARNWLTERYGKSNLLHWAVHYDETTPHMHAVFLPIVQTPEGARYTADKFIGKRDDLKAFQTEIAEQLGKGFNLERGVLDSGTRHNDQAGWAKELKKKEKQLQKQEASQKAKEWSLRSIEAGLEAKETILNDRENAVGRQEIHLAAQAVDLEKRETELKALNETVGAIWEAVKSDQQARWWAGLSEGIPPAKWQTIFQAAEDKADQLRQEQAQKRQKDKGRDQGR